MEAQIGRCGVGRDGPRVLKFQQRIGERELMKSRQQSIEIHNFRICETMYEDRCLFVCLDVTMS
jgi:hypothetical protein